MFSIKITNPNTKDLASTGSVNITTTEQLQNNPARNKLKDFSEKTFFIVWKKINNTVVST